MTTRRTLFTLSAVAMLLGTAPALTLADTATKGTACDAGCPCAKKAEAARSSGQPTESATQADEAFLQLVWSAP